MAETEETPKGLWITYDVEEMDCTPPNEFSGADMAGFLLSAISGSAVVGLDERSFSISTCGLLDLSHSLISLVTFPVFFDEPAVETVVGQDADLRSSYCDGRISLELIRLGARDSVVFDVPLDDAMETVGNFHLSLLRRLFRECPKLRMDGRLLVALHGGFRLFADVTRPV